MKIMTFVKGDYQSTYKGVLSIAETPNGEFCVTQDYEGKILAHVFDKETTIVVSK